METSRTLLHHLAKGGESEFWDQFVGIYSPIIELWLNRNTIPSNDVSDLKQEVLMALANALPQFQHNGRVGAFRAWLKQVTLNRCRRYWDSKKKQSRLGANAGQQMLDELEDPQSELSQIWNRDHDQHILSVLLATVKGDFSERTIQMFERTAIEGIAAKTVAKDLNAKMGQVYKAKFRVMSRLQLEAQRLFDSVRIRSEKGTYETSN